MSTWDKEKKKEWRRKNPEKCREYERRYREKHAAKIRKQCKKYYQKNKEAVLESNKRYRTKHPEYYHKFRKMMDKTIHNRAIAFEDYDLNIELAQLDIQCEIRTKIERKVFE